MVEKIYLNLLFLCGILSQGILAHENIKKPSDMLIRQKRVINRMPGEDKKVAILDAPFIVHIKENMRIECVGTILSYHVVITIAECVSDTSAQYHVFSTSSHSDYGNRHNITSIRRHFGNHPHRPRDGVALLIVDPPFSLRRHTSTIELHSGPLLPDTVGTVYGWGFNFRSENRGTQHPRNLRSIEVPILSHRQCVDIYRPHDIVISDKDICTFHSDKNCGHTDGGAPLVVNGYLAGIHLWTGIGGRQSDCRYPDVFLIVQHIEYNRWITSNVEEINTSFRNRS